jgi:hypothetical protein
MEFQQLILSIICKIYLVALKKLVHRYVKEAAWNLWRHNPSGWGPTNVELSYFKSQIQPPPSPRGTYFQSFLLLSVSMARTKLYPSPTTAGATRPSCLWLSAHKFRRCGSQFCPPRPSRSTATQPNIPLDRSRSLQILVEDLRGSEMRGREKVTTVVGFSEHNV